MPNSPKNITIASTFAASTALSSIIYFNMDFPFYGNCGSEYII